MRLLTIDLLCQELDQEQEPCGYAWFETVNRDELEAGRLPICPACKGSAVVRTPSAPRVMNASLPDHVRRKGFREQAESYRIESESFNLPPEKRGEHKKEIAKIRTVKK